MYIISCRLSFLSFYPVAVSSGLDGYLRVWDVESGKEENHIQSRPGTGGEEVLCVWGTGGEEVLCV